MKGWVGLALGVLIALAGCATPPTTAQRRALAEQLVAAHGWLGRRLPTPAFVLQAYAPASLSAEELTVYIEGDGLAWLSPDWPSLDPTPQDPLALRLALAQPPSQGAAAYLARPCQYPTPDSPVCEPRYWREARFAPEVIEANNHALDQLKQQAGARRLRLVGYSGGAAVAALVAARRDDVVALVSVAGNLDPPAWAQWHHYSPLLGSLNPLDAAPALGLVRQWHLQGGRDPSIPPALAANFAARVPGPLRPQLRQIPEFDHRCCWVAAWPSLWVAMMAEP